MNRRDALRKAAGTVAAAGLALVVPVALRGERQEVLLRHLYADDPEAKGLVPVLDGRRVEHVTEVMEGQWCVALACPPGGKWPHRSGKDFREVKVYGDVRLVPDKDAEHLPSRYVYA